jgi:hypothetical protein
MIRYRVLLLVVLLAACGCAVAQTGKVERLGAFADKEANEKIVPALEEKGYRVTVGAAPFAELWLAKSTEDAKTGNSSAAYPQIAKGSFVGVIRFVTTGKDFRGQEIKAGAYTMRYDLLPSDGNHMGAAAQPDFVVLVQVEQDFDPSKPMPERVMVNLGKRSSGTAHPLILSLTPADGAKELPAVFKNGDGFDVFAAPTKIGGKETPFAIVLKGQAAQ